MQSGKIKILQNLFFLLAWGYLEIGNPAKLLICKLETTAKCDRCGKTSMRTGRCWSSCWPRLCCMGKVWLLVEISVAFLNFLVPP